MRISVDPKDRGFCCDGKRYEAYLNGYRLRYCITADDELNEAIVYDTDENGDPAIDPDQLGFLTKRIEGEIEIRQIEDGKMKDQHEKIKGYRDLTQEEIDSMNEIKEAAERIGTLVDVIQNTQDSDARWVSIGRTHLQQGFMALVRAIAKPESF